MNFDGSNQNGLESNRRFGFRSDFSCTRCHSLSQNTLAHS